MSDLAALILTYNEDSNIEECLESVKWIDELVVVDSYSNDDTVNLAKKYTNQVYQRRFDDFASQRNFGLEQIKSEWVLVIDADERVTTNLRNEIINKLKDGSAMGYEIPRKNYFLGKWIKHCGWYPDYTLRLFKSHNRYRGLVHEGVEIEGEIKHFSNAFIHYTYRDLEHYLSKINHYTSLDAEKKYKAGKKKGITYIILRPVLEFIKKYFLKKGFLLGIPGLIVAVLSSYYQFLKYIKLWEKNQFQSGRGN